MNRRIVELNALTDTDRTCAEHDDLLFLGKAGGILTRVGGIEVRNIRTRVAGIHHTEGRDHIIFITVFHNLTLAYAPRLRNISVGEAKSLCLTESVGVTLFLDYFLPIGDVLYFFKEELGDLGDIVDLVNRYATAK